MLYMLTCKKKYLYGCSTDDLSMLNGCLMDVDLCWSPRTLPRLSRSSVCLVPAKPAQLPLWLPTGHKRMRFAANSQGVTSEASPKQPQHSKLQVGCYWQEWNCHNGNGVLLCQVFSCKLLGSEPAPSFFSIWYRPFATVEGGFEPWHGSEVRCWLSIHLPSSPLPVIRCLHTSSTAWKSTTNKAPWSILKRLHGCSWYMGISWYIMAYQANLCSTESFVESFVSTGVLWGLCGQGVCASWSLTPFWEKCRQVPCEVWEWQRQNTSEPRQLHVKSSKWFMML